MQDSLNDYIKIARNQEGNEGTLGHETFQNILRTAEHKKQCEGYAQKVVEFLIDGKIKPKIFLRCLHFINNILYDDVIEERSVSKICGYPICGNSLPDMPAKQYIILTNVNKVFDITERKHYCSNFCFKASKHIKSQIDESPLWLRKSNNIASFKLLEETDTNLTPGEEIVYGIPKNEATKFTSVSDFAEASLDNVHEIEKVSAQSNGHDDMHNTKLDVTHTPHGDLENQQRELNESIKNVCKTMNIDMNSELKLSAGSSKNIKKKDVRIDMDRMNLAMKKTHISEKNKNSDALETQKYINSAGKCNKLEEIPLPKYAQRIKGILDKSANKTTHDIHAINEKMKHMKINTKRIPKNDNLNQVLLKLKDKDANFKKGIKLIEAMPNPEQKVNVMKYDKTVLFKSKLAEEDGAMIKSCFKNWLSLESYMYILGEDEVKATLNREKLAQCIDELKLQEKERWQQARYLEICKKLNLKEIAEEKLSSSQLSKAALRPVPDYHELKQEVKESDKNVKAFFSGEIIVKSLSKTTTLPENDTENDDSLAVLPLADATSHNALRRCIFNKAVHKFIKDHLRDLEFDESADVKVFEFIATFKLEAHNVVFKPEQWNVIALILLYCLGKVDSALAEALDAKNYIECCQKKYSMPITNEFFEYIDETIMNVELFLTDSIKKT